MKQPSQKEMIIKYMNDFGSITTYINERFICCTKLTTRISELRRDGFIIIGEPQTGTNRWGKSVKFNRYRMGETSG